MLLVYLNVRLITLINRIGRALQIFSDSIFGKEISKQLEKPSETT